MSDVARYQKPLSESLTLNLDRFKAGHDGGWQGLSAAVTMQVMIDMYGANSVGPDAVNTLMELFKAGIEKKDGKGKHALVAVDAAKALLALLKAGMKEGKISLSAKDNTFIKDNLLILSGQTKKPLVSARASGVLLGFNKFMEITLKDDELSSIKENIWTIFNTHKNNMGINDMAAARSAEELVALKKDIPSQDVTTLKNTFNTNAEAYETDEQSLEAGLVTAALGKFLLSRKLPKKQTEKIKKTLYYIFSRSSSLDKDTETAYHGVIADRVAEALLVNPGEGLNLKFMKQLLEGIADRNIKLNESTFPGMHGTAAARSIQVISTMDI